MCTLAFAALLRVSEFTQSQHNLTIDNIRANISNIYNITNTDFIILTFSSYKFSTSFSPSIKIIARPEDITCSVTNLARYMFLRGSKKGPLFMTPSGNAVSRNFFINSVKSSLHIAGFPVKSYNSHSFRVGGATEAAERGLSAMQIQLLGRWRTSAFHKYIRKPSIVI